MKMHEIRFALIVNWIQMRQKKVSSIPEKGEVEEWEPRQQTRPAPDRQAGASEWKRS
jgi:hypothetical protein